jgi:hypothetical protein
LLVFLAETVFFDEWEIGCRDGVTEELEFIIFGILWLWIL